MQTWITLPLSHSVEPRAVRVEIPNSGGLVRCYTFNYPAAEHYYSPS